MAVVLEAAEELETAMVEGVRVRWAWDAAYPPEILPQADDMEVLSDALMRIRNKRSGSAAAEQIGDG
ncbi:hypothetical protein [Nocardia callitridis]|uniref:Uncharacterized protein n=1 Tax=Nocardia callitridis TaxID=648753 RepID=A0ABP9KF16_9NOCA